LNRQALPAMPRKDCWQPVDDHIQVNVSECRCEN
jgi:hypothetical protein